MSGIAPREYSKRLGVLTPEQLQAALDRFDLGTLIAADEAPGGLFGQNVMIESTTGRWVLRGAPHYDWQFAKERYFARMIHERTAVPAPWPYMIDDTTGIFGWRYAIMPRLPGDALTDDVRQSLSPEDRVGIARAMGEGLAALQEAIWPVHAWYDIEREALLPLEEPYADWYIGWTRYWLDQCRKASEATTDQDVAWVEEVAASAADALAVPFQAALVHTDYHEGNVVVARDGEGWRVSGIFDLMDPYMGDGESDLPRSYAAFHLKDPRASAVFLGAYLALRPPRDGFAARFRLYMLRDRLVFWEYGQRNKLWFRPGMRLRDWAERFVELPLSV